MKLLFLNDFFFFVLARFAVTLPPLWIKVAVLFAAMPTGANAFLFAQRNDEAVPANLSSGLRHDAGGGALLTARVSTGHDPALGASTASVV